MCIINDRVGRNSISANAVPANFRTPDQPGVGRVPPRTGRCRAPPSQPPRRRCRIDFRTTLWGRVGGPRARV